MSDVGTKPATTTLEDMIWQRQYAIREGEDFVSGAHRVGDSVTEDTRDASSYASLITSKRFIPGGRILAGAGSEHGNLLNCFVQDGAPFEGGTTGGVLLLARKLALVTKVGGGNGLNLDEIAPRSEYTGPTGTAWLTISDEHADYDKVREGTHMDLVRGQYVTPGYKALRFAGHEDVPGNIQTINVEDSVDGIWVAAGEMVHALLEGQQVAIDLSNLRPEGTTVKGSGGSSSGPASFAVEVFEQFARWASLGGAEYAGPVATLRYIYAPTLRVIRQAGVRRGAGMATLSATHPDLPDFITAKDLSREADEGDISTFNISVLASDAFMRDAITRPDSPERQTLDLVANHAWQTGEPGLIFIDAINFHNPLALVDGPIMATNPCVTADTWVMTSEGARQVSSLIGRTFRAVVDGKDYKVESDGFFSTGVKPVLRITTASGFELRLTGNHQLKRVNSQTRYTQETSWVEADALLPGDRIMLQNHREVTPWNGAGNYDEGWLLGSLTGDGTFRRDRATPQALLDYWGDERDHLTETAHNAINNLSIEGDRTAINGGAAVARTRVASSATTRLAAEFGITADSKTVTDQVEEASYDFYRGFLRGLFDADGSVQGTQEKGVSVRLAQSDLVMLQRVQRMLSRLGVISTIYEERRAEGTHALPDGRGGSKEYQIRAQHELVISNDNLQQFTDLIGFESPAKQARLTMLLSQYARTPNRERFSDEIVAISQDGMEEVFDVTVQDVHAFDANGFMAHNCGEIPLYPGEPCDLGAINLSAHVVDGRVDRTALERTTRTATRFLDDVLTAENSPLPEIHDAIMDKRRIGLGVMGLADMLIKLGVGYNSNAGRQAVREVIGILRDAALEESAALGAERGIPEGVRRAGLERRNIAVFTVAPTGTTSMIAGVSGGVEPVFAATYTRRIGTEYVKVVHPLLEDILNSLTPTGIYARDGEWDQDAILADLNQNHGSLQPLLDELPADPRLDAFCIAHDISPEDHVLMQATVQRAFDWTSEQAWFDRSPAGMTKAGNSISKTCNMPNQASVRDVTEAYELAWAEGCKGITVYRDGSRDLQVLTTTGKEEAKEEPQAAAPAPAPVAVAPAAPAPAVRQDAGVLKEYDRENRMTGITDKVNLGNSAGVNRGFFITVNSDSGGQPREVFIMSGKGGDEANGDSEALGRLTSIALQYGVPAEAIIKTLRGIGGGMFGTYQGRIVTSKADLIAVALETSPGVTPVQHHDHAASDGCPHCGGELRRAEGCLTCENMECGWSKCG